jgi:hypothetical protein
VPSSTFGIDLGFDVLYKLAVTIWAYIALTAAIALEGFLVPKDYKAPQK